MKEVTTIATQLAELNEHLVAIIDCLPCGDGGDDSCSEEIAKIQEELAETIRISVGEIEKQLGGIETRVKRLEESVISGDFSKRNALINEVLLSLKEEDRLTLEKLYDLAFGESKPGILSEKLPPDTDQVKHRETLNKCRQAQALPPRT
ncbi:MAG: hypothetical protein EWV47_11745 [Microcystis viridis Mv_BB_P_19951000_S68]|uniref:Uncharacterized protein n=1 Tax=Microcystis viridis Mv_BB_P_19951000_S68D TaxID=2486270 RepID=A0A552HAV3_MICVR|nr:MAG: hypothetical protein EWV77_20440 [Microcystis viridis Mv_BB_P_19951000_S68D]TRU74008.1 MAG: hypothetical protein EWV47_11745 [Microcystis viridis Mv_BB_P_19951000_S68]